MRRNRAVWTLAIVMTACQRPAPDTAVAKLSLQPSGPESKAASPMGALDSPAADEREITGVVTERLVAGRYSYLCLDADGTRVWIATTGAGAEVGQRVHVRSLGTRRDFESPRLGRRFDELVFGVVRVVDSPLARENT